MNYDWTIQEYDRKKDPAKQVKNVIFSAAIQDSLDQ